MSSKTPSDTPGEVSDSHPSAENSKKKPVKSVISRIGLDMIPVVAGILIALFINNLQQDYRDKKLLESTLQSLSNEFTDNAAEITENLPFHLRLIDTLQHYKESEHHSIHDMVTKVGKLSTANIFTTNWQATLNNNSLGFLNYKTVQLLSDIDAQQQEMRKQEEMLLPVVLGPPMYKRGKEGLEYRLGLEKWLLTFIGNEEALLGLYEEFEQVVRNKQYIQDANK
jgi:hypothetical protein